MAIEPAQTTPPPQTLQADAVLMAFYICGATPDRNAQTDAEMEATESAVGLAVNRTLRRFANAGR